MGKLNLIPYMGGKTYMTKQISSLLDYSKSCYIELFGGGGSVLLNKPKHKVEIINDINDDIYSLYKVLIEKPEEFLQKIENYHYCEKLFYELRDSKPKDIVDKAIRIYYLCNIGFSGKIQTISISFVAGREKSLKFENKKQKLPKIIERLKYVQVLNRDYKLILDSIVNKEDIMLYADPPYYGTEFYYDNSKFTKEDHEILAKYLNDAKYSVMVSYYYFDGIEDLYPKSKWKYIEIEQVKHSFGVTKNSKSNKKPRSVELLLLNYETDKIL